MKKKGIDDDKLNEIAADFFIEFNNKLIDAGATSRQIMQTAHCIAMSVTLEALGIGPGSRVLLNNVLSELHRTYLNEWEKLVEEQKNKK